MTPDHLLCVASLSTFPWKRGIDRCWTTVFGEHALPWQQIRRKRQTNLSSVCSVCDPHRRTKGHVIDSQESVVLIIVEN
jgi:hypothetical protein